MTPENFEQSIRELARRAPFKPFTIELVSGDRFEAQHPEAVAFGGGTAVYISPKGVPRLFDHESVRQLIRETGLPSGSRG